MLMGAGVHLDRAGEEAAFMEGAVSFDEIEIIKKLGAGELQEHAHGGAPLRV